MAEQHKSSLWEWKGRNMFVGEAEKNAVSVWQKYSRKMRVTRDRY